MKFDVVTDVTMQDGKLHVTKTTWSDRTEVEIDNDTLGKKVSLGITGIVKKAWLSDDGLFFTLDVKGEEVDVPAKHCYQKEDK